VHFLHQHTPFIRQTTCTFLISTNIKWTSATCYSTCAPSSGRLQCLFLEVAFGSKPRATSTVHLKAIHTNIKW